MLKEVLLVDCPVCMNADPVVKVALGCEEETEEILIPVLLFEEESPLLSICSNAVINLNYGFDVTSIDVDDVDEVLVSPYDEPQVVVE